MNNNYPKKLLQIDPKTILSKDKTNWGYLDEFGPDYWHKLHPSFIIAKIGNEQSPVNIVTDSTKKLNFIDMPEYNYLYSRYQLINKKYFMRLQIANSYNYIKLDNSFFYLQHIDIHTPSEHWIDGEYYPLELELYHENNKNEVVIISVFGIEGKENKIVAEAISKTNVLAKSKKLGLSKKFNALDLIPKNGTVYRYRGSLTTPPTKENVRWVIYHSPITFSIQQIENYRSCFHYSARPIQSLNYRKVFAYDPIFFKIIV